MSKYFKKAISLMELIIVLAIIAVLIIPTIDLMSSMLIAHADYNNNLNAKQIKLNMSERITNGIREGAYIYPANTSLTIPTMSSTATTTVGTSAIAVLVPVFTTDGSIEYSNTTGKTSFKGIAYSIIPGSSWASGTDDYVLVETVYNTSLSVDPDYNLEITETAPVNWGSGSSFMLAGKLEPARLTNMGTTAFNINNNIVTFGFVPGASTTYFPSSSGSASVDDTPYISSVVVQNS